MALALLFVSGFLFGLPGAAMALPPVIPLHTPVVEGQIALQGGYVSRLVLKEYPVEARAGSPAVCLLSEEEGRRFHVRTGWIAEEATGITLPDETTVWSTQGTELTPETPLVLSWKSPEGLGFQRTFAIDNQYVVTVTDSVSGAHRPLKVAVYSAVRRQGPVDAAGYFVLHEGFVGVINDKLTETSWKDLEEKPVRKTMDQAGWLGLTDKYWLVALVHQGHTPATVNGYGNRGGHGLWYQVDAVTPFQTLESGQAWSHQTRFFAGPKVLSMLDAYEPVLGIPRFDLAIDFGLFYFITRPMFQVLNALKGFFGSFGWAILFLTVVVKGLFFPLANKSYRAMGRMKKLQPEIERLKEIYGEDKARMNQALMDLYRTHKVNPLAGCLPMVVQIPVFFALYKVLFVTIEMRHAPFVGWVHDLSAPDPTNLFTLFGLLSWSPPAFMHLGVWPVLMGITMFLQQRLSPQPADPVQQKMMMFLPVVFTFTLGSFPVGLVIYWAWSNTLSIGQQWLIGWLDRRSRKEPRPSRRKSKA